jgi:hypothetical protein
MDESALIKLVMSNPEIYQLFITHLDIILQGFDDLKDNCPADFDDELAELIIKAENLTQRAYAHALANKEN